MKLCHLFSTAIAGYCVTDCMWCYSFIHISHGAYFAADSAKSAGRSGRLLFRSERRLMTCLVWHM